MSGWSQMRFTVSWVPCTMLRRSSHGTGAEGPQHHKRLPEPKPLQPLLSPRHASTVNAHQDECLITKSCGGTLHLAGQVVAAGAGSPTRGAMICLAYSIHPRLQVQVHNEPRAAPAQLSLSQRTSIALDHWQLTPQASRKFP